METLSHILIHGRNIPYLNTWPEDPSRLSAAIAYLNTCGSSTPPTSSARISTTVLPDLLPGSQFNDTINASDDAITLSGDEFNKTGARNQIIWNLSPISGPRIIIFSNILIQLTSSQAIVQ